MLLNTLIPGEHMGKSGDEGNSLVSWPLLQAIDLSRIPFAEPKVLSNVISDRISLGIPLLCVLFGSVYILQDR
jgi:hypothetical protein